MVIPPAVQKLVDPPNTRLQLAAPFVCSRLNGIGSLGGGLQCMMWTLSGVRLFDVGWLAGDSAGGVFHNVPSLLKDPTACLWLERLLVP